MSETYRITIPGHPIEGELVEYVGPAGDPFASLILGVSEYRILDVTPEVEAAFQEAFEGREIPEGVDVERVFLSSEDVELVEAAA